MAGLLKLGTSVSRHVQRVWGGGGAGDRLGQHNNQNPPKTHAVFSSSDRHFTLRDPTTGTGLSLCFAYGSQPGLAKGRNNEDTTLLRPGFLESDCLSVFAIFDGHGPNGEACAAFVSNQVEEALMEHLEDLGLAQLCLVPDEVLANACKQSFLDAEQVRKLRKVTLRLGCVS